MHELLDSFLSWIGTNPQWAYLIVFVVALAESIAVIGMIVPGVMILFGAGALIATGDLAFWPTAAAAVAGAVLGDGFSYWLGHRYGDQLLHRWPLNRYPKQFERGVAFFDRYGGKSVAFGRFFGPGRAIIPLVAGIMQMRPSRFAVANLTSAMAWGPAYLAPGIVFGASLKLAAEAAARLAILLLVLIALIWLAGWLGKQLYLLISPHASAWVQALLRWGNLHPVLGRTAQALADRDHPDAPTLAGLAVALVGASAILGIAISAELAGPQDLALNQTVLDLGQSLHTPLATHIMIALSRLGEPVVTLPLVAAILVYLAANRQRRALFYWLAALGFPLIVAPTLGWLVRVHRPEIGLDLAWPWSFPSAQVLTATVLYGFLALSLARTLPPRRRWLPYAGAAIVLTAVMIARLYLGTEWLTDLVGTVALGLAWIAALGLAFHRHTELPPESAGLWLLTVAAAGIAFSTATVAEQRSDLVRYTPAPSQTAISAAHWRARADLPVAEHREDLWHRNAHAFDIQYAGALEPFSQALAERGWKRPELLSWSNAIKLLSPSLPLQSLPVVPHVHDGRHDKLTLVKDLSDGQRLVLRLWSTGARITPSETGARETQTDIKAGDGAPLWTGTVTRLIKDNVMDLFALPLTRPADALGKRTLRDDLEQSSAIAIDPGDPILIAPVDLRLLTH